jgi:signal transduction histidine kinase
MYLKKYIWLNDGKVGVRTWSVLFSGLVVIVSITLLLFLYTQNLLKERLEERIQAIVSTAVVSISPSDIESSLKKDSNSEVVQKKLATYLAKIRDSNNDVRFVYLLHRTSDPDNLAFIVDAESFISREDQEKRAGKELKDDELAPIPGDLLLISDYPALKDEAFYHPAVEKKLQKDQWSTQISAYAPIFGVSGDAVAVLGIDVEVTDYLTRIRQTLLPFTLFIVFLALLLTLLTLLLIRFWGDRVKSLQDLDRQKDELLGMVSHQLAKPITAIKWNLESMIDGDIGNLNPEQKESAGTMQSMATNLADLVSMILDVSRIQLGKVKMDPQPLDLNEFFHEIVSVIEPTIKEKKINFVQDIYPKKLPTVLLDKRYTRMTIENLLTNAIKYTPEGGTVKLWVQVTNNTLHCSVTDTGCGIPKAEQEKIFGKMFRASNVRNTMDGNGFGLYVAKGAVEGQGGRIWFQSTEGKGTTFFVDLPAKPAEQQNVGK